MNLFENHEKTFKNEGTKAWKDFSKVINEEALNATSSSELGQIINVIHGRIPVIISKINVVPKSYPDFENRCKVAIEESQILIRDIHKIGSNIPSKNYKQIYLKLEEQLNDFISIIKDKLNLGKNDLQKSSNDLNDIAVFYEKEISQLDDKYNGSNSRSYH